LGILALQPLEPAYISLLPLVEARGFGETDAEIVGALAVSDAVRMVTTSEETADTVTFDQSSAVPVPVTVSVRDGRVSSLVLEGAPLLEALRESGQPLSEDVEAGLPEASYRAAFPATVEPRDVTAPSEDPVVAEETGEQGC